MIYFMQAEAVGPIKIGCTKNLRSRHRSLEIYYGRQLRILAVIPGDFDDERAIHLRFAHLRIGRTEQFRPAPDLLEFIGLPSTRQAGDGMVEAMPVPDRDRVNIGFRVRIKWISWLREYAKFRRLNVPSAIDEALACAAKELGYKEPPIRLR